MFSIRILQPAGFILMVLLWSMVQAQTPPSGAPMPDIRQLMREVQEHQKQLDKVRENYTYSSVQTIQDIDGKGQVTKTETVEREHFFVNGRGIERVVKRDGKPLDDHAQQKESERVTKAVEEAQMPEKPKEGDTISLSKMLEVLDVRNPRRENYRGRATIVFDFAGRKDLKAHGLSEDASKKLQGTVWVDEADRQVAHLDVSFIDNFHIGGGLVANIQKGSRFSFDQAPVNGELWLPTGGEGTVDMRVFLVKGVRQHFIERDSDFKRFSVDTQQSKDAKALVETKQPEAK